MLLGAGDAPLQFAICKRFLFFFLKDLYGKMVFTYIVKEFGGFLGREPRYELLDSKRNEKNV